MMTSVTHYVVEEDAWYLHGTEFMMHHEGKKFPFDNAYKMNALP